MKHDSHAEPVTLNCASARTIQRPSLIPIILGVLTALSLIVARFLASTGCHYDPAYATRISMLSLSSAFALYNLHVGTYPTSLDDFVRAPAGEAAAKWRGSYVEDLSRLSDAWGRRFEYKAPGLHNSQHYDLWSMGKDGEDGTDDDIGNWVSDDP